MTDGINAAAANALAHTVAPDYFAFSIERTNQRMAAYFALCALPERTPEQESERIRLARLLNK